jgi:hypothetical protein
MFTLQTSFKPLLLERIRLVEVTVNSNEENSSDFCSSYVQEFGLSSTCTVMFQCLGTLQAYMVGIFSEFAYSALKRVFLSCSA